MVSMNNGNVQRDPDTFDVRASIKAIITAARHYKWTVITVCLITLLLTTVYVIVWPPVYSATATIMVERDTDPVRDSFYLGWNVFRKDDARTEIELMTAGPVIKEVVEKEDLEYEEVYHPFMSHAAYLWGESAVGQWYRGMKKYLLGGPGPDAPSEEDLELARTILDMRAGVSIEPVAESNVGRVTVLGPTRRVADMANTLVDTYLQRRRDRHTKEAEKSYEILSKQVDVAGDELAGIVDRRRVFLEENGLVFDFQKESLEVTKLTDLEENIRTTRMRVAALEASLSALDTQLESEPEHRTTTTTYQLNDLRQRLRLKKQALQAYLAELDNRYRKDAPEVKEVEHQITELQELIDSAEEMVEAGSTQGLNVVRQELLSKRATTRVELEGARKALGVLEADATRMRERLASVPSKQARLRSLDREYALSQEKYQQLLSKQAQAKVSLVTAEAAMSSMRVVEYAVPPAKKSWPKPKLLFPAALVIGLGAGLAGALLRSFISSRLRRDHIEQGRGDSPLYGRIKVVSRGRALAAVLGDKDDGGNGSRTKEATGSDNGN